MLEQTSYGSLGRPRSEAGADLEISRSRAKIGKFDRHGSKQNDEARPSGEEEDKKRRTNTRGWWVKTRRSLLRSESDSPGVQWI